MNILIVEDDAIQLNGLKHIITENYASANTFTAQSYDEAVCVIDTSDIDIFMLDINLGSGKNGLDVCSYIRNKSEFQDTPVIFITDVTNPTLDVINKYHCKYYFSKPYNSSDVVSAIDTVTASSKESPVKLQLKDIQGILFHIDPDDIIYVEASGHHKHIFTSGNDFIITNPTFESMMEQNTISLIRCHKSYFFNFNYIQSYDRANSLIKLSGTQSSIPLGRKYKNTIEEYLENK